MISSAGHPPAAHYDAAAGRWRLTRARGIVLGVVPDLRGAATEPERGVLQRGDALMLYTDGLVEAPGRDIDAGTDRLLGEAERMLVQRLQDRRARRLVDHHAAAQRRLRRLRPGPHLADLDPGPARPGNTPAWPGGPMRRRSRRLRP